jgi:hypothetical protein
LIAPQVSPQAYIDTSKGTIQFELAVLDAPARWPTSSRW